MPWFSSTQSTTNDLESGRAPNTTGNSQNQAPCGQGQGRNTVTQPNSASFQLMPGWGTRIANLITTRVPQEDPEAQKKSG